MHLFERNYFYLVRRECIVYLWPFESNCCVVIIGTLLSHKAFQVPKYFPFVLSVFQKEILASKRENSAFSVLSNSSPNYNAFGYGQVQLSIFLCLIFLQQYSLLNISMRQTHRETYFYFFKISDFTSDVNIVILNFTRVFSLKIKIS